MTSDIHAAIQQAQTRPTVAQTLDRMLPDIQRAIPKGLDPDRVSRIALTAIRQSDLAKAKGTAKSSLSECSPESFAGSLLTAVALGLEPNLGGQCYLIPYQDRRNRIVECQLIIGYQGLVDLFRRHPMARHIGAQAVYANDHFEYQYGSDKYLKHRPAAKDRGDIVAYYADASLSNGSYEFEVLTVDEVKALRGGKVGSSGDIPDPMHWMERKTALRQLLKLLPKQTTVEAALDADEKPGKELLTQQAPQTIVNPPAAIEPSPESVPDNVDAVTGEITEPAGEDWPEVTQPAQGGGK